MKFSTLALTALSLASVNAIAIRDVTVTSDNIVETDVLLETFYTTVPCSDSATGTAAASTSATLPTIPSALVEAAAAEHELTVGNGSTCYWNSEEMYESMLAFFTYFMYPENAVIASTINSTILAEDITGLIDLTRKFEGRELNTEYLFGLFANLNNAEDASFNLVGYPVAFEVAQFVANCNLAHISVITNWSYPLLNVTYPIQIDTRVRLNSLRQIESYEVTFVRLQWLFAITNELATTALLAAAEAEGDTSGMSGADLLKLKTVESICQVADTFCTGDNKQYNSTAECHDYLFNQTRFGEAYEGGFDTVFCRSLHQNMIHLRPEVHCPHIGPTGGMYCTDADMDYETIVLDWGMNYLGDMIKV